MKYCLRAELAEEFGVTSKSIQRDINALNDFCANRLVESGEQSSINKYFPDELWNMHQRGGSVQKTGPDNRIQIIRGKGKVREEIFKENTSYQVKSPENLDSFIQVANPSVWILLISVVILLSGACVWAFFGHVNSTVKTIVHAENGSYICYVSEENISAVQVGKAVKIDGFDAVISEIGQRTNQGYVCVLQSDQLIPDGIYDGKIVIRSIKPISFIVN